MTDAKTHVTDTIDMTKLINMMTAGGQGSIDLAIDVGDIAGPLPTLTTHLGKDTGIGRGGTIISLGSIGGHQEIDMTEIDMIETEGINISIGVTPEIDMRVRIDMGVKIDMRIRTEKRMLSQSDQLRV